MFKKNPFFVVGAGASAEPDLPLGSVLAQSISAKMDIRFERGFESVGRGDLNLFSQVTSNSSSQTNFTRRDVSSETAYCYQDRLMIFWTSTETISV